MDAPVNPHQGSLLVTTETPSEMDAPINPHQGSLLVTTETPSENPPAAQPIPEKVYSGKSGRPAFFVPKEVLEAYISLKMTQPAIAKSLRISKGSVKKLLKENGLSTNYCTTKITEQELDKAVEEVTSINPANIGYRACHTMLQQEKNIHVPVHTVRLSLKRVNPMDVANRYQAKLKRRRYKSKGPNAVWHIDGHHKMVRKCGLYIHGGIDGFSRLITFLKVSADNKKDTVVKYFMEAVDTYGLPEKVRMDQGVENREVERYMLERRHGGSCLIGKSVHNQRIERLWVDVQHKATSIFVSLLELMEELGNYNPADADDVCALQWAFKNHIQKTLDSFTNMWNAHRMKHQGPYKTPEQLHIGGCHDRIESQSGAVRGMLEASTSSASTSSASTDQSGSSSERRYPDELLQTVLTPAEIILLRQTIISNNPVPSPELSKVEELGFYLKVFLDAKAAIRQLKASRIV